MAKQAGSDIVGRRLWRFEDYLLPSGNNPIEEWLDDEGPSVEADFDASLKYLSITKVWSYPEYKPLGSGLGEIRFKTNKVQYRVVGCHGKKGGGLFVLLIGCSHKEGVYQPPNALDTAARRRAEYDLNTTRVEERLLA